MRHAVFPVAEYRRRVRARLALVSVWLLACGPQKPASQCSPAAAPMVKPPVPLAFVGEPLALEVPLPPAVFCQNGNPLATAVVTEVLDAQNQRVPHERTEPTSSDTKGYSTTIRFTPTTRGVFYLSAQFEPALGIAQRQVQVMGDRTTEAPAFRFPLPAPCDEVWPLERAVLCRRGATLSVWRDGGVEFSEPIAGVVSAEGVGWWWTDARLTRAEEGDGGLLRSELAVSMPAGPTTATAMRFTHVAGDVFDVQALDGGLTLRRWTPGWGVVTGPGVARAGDVVGVATATQLCAGAEDASVFCIENPLTPGLGSGDALWLRGTETGSVAVARFGALVREPAVLFLPAQSSTLTDTRQLHPTFTWNGRLITVRASDLTLEAWRAPGPYTRLSVSDEHVIFHLQSGELVIYRR